MIDFNGKSGLSDRINYHIDTALETAHRFEKRRSYLGGSRLGLECERALQYEFCKAPVDPDKTTNGRIIRVFARGHWIESAMIEWLRDAGFGLIKEDRDGRQFGFTAHNGYVQGHGDGVLVSGPAEFGPWPRLWECKGLEQKYFLALKRHKLKNERPVYYGQCQYYMDHLGLTSNPALFCAVNANRMEIHWEEIPFDKNYASSLDHKAARIIQACKAQELLPRISHEPEFYKCKMCNWQNQCHA